MPQREANFGIGTLAHARTTVLCRRGVSPRLWLDCRLLGRGGADRETSMTPTRLLAALLFASPLVASVPHSAEAESYRPWCAQYYGFGGGGTNCGFISYEQCMMTAFGAGAWCVQNPWYLAYGDGSQKTAATARRARSRQR